jgi:uncharacterized protein involved in exopolysaccharide biosynthesis
MTENATQRPQAADDEIDLRELFAVIWRGKWIIIAVTAVFAVASVFYALSLPNIYKSEALLAPAGEQKSGGLSGQLGGLAALAGVNLGSGAGVDKTALAIEVLKSRDFITRFIERHNILVDLMAIERWDINTNTIEYNPEVYDVSIDRWTREVKKPKSSMPSMQEAYKVFEKQFRIEQDQTTGMVRISIEHQSPNISKRWVELLISDINLEMKQRDILEAESSISYLKKQILETEIADVRTALFSLIEEQTKTLMLANVRSEYAFKTVDSALAPEEKSSPKRAIIVILITFIGGFASTIFVLVSSTLSRKS